MTNTKPLDPEISEKKTQKILKEAGGGQQAPYLQEHW